MIKFSNINKSFKKVKVLNNISLEIEEKGIISILGPNGSGKTTLIKSLLGMVIPGSGKIFFKEKEIRREWKYRDHISYLPQIAQFPENLRVMELIELVKDIRRMSSREEMLIDIFNLEKDLNKKFAYLSGGTKQKVNLTIAFMFDTDVLILDEPSNGLDPAALYRLKELIAFERDRGKLILLTTHIMNIVEDLSERIVYLLEGDIIFDGTPKALKSLQNENSIEKSLLNFSRESNV